MASAGAEQYTFHVEAAGTNDPSEIIRKIKEAGMKVKVITCGWSIRTRML